ncbi:collagen alpha-1(I) chain-like [Ictidomys tridecemlineatus]|nr:collagen alpha-1(I) chain-like [Ictidomys tridecemlineatus]
MDGYAKGCKKGAAPPAPCPRRQGPRRSSPTRRGRRCGLTDHSGRGPPGGAAARPRGTPWGGSAPQSRSTLASDPGHPAFPTAHSGPGDTGRGRKVTGAIFLPPPGAQTRNVGQLRAQDPRRFTSAGSETSAEATSRRSGLFLSGPHSGRPEAGPHFRDDVITPRLLPRGLVDASVAAALWPRGPRGRPGWPSTLSPAVQGAVLSALYEPEDRRGAPRAQGRVHSPESGPGGPQGRKGRDGTTLGARSVWPRESKPDPPFSASCVGRERETRGASPTTAAGAVCILQRWRSEGRRRFRAAQRWDSRLGRGKNGPQGQKNGNRRGRGLKTGNNEGERPSRFRTAGCSGNARPIRIQRAEADCELLSASPLAPRGASVHSCWISSGSYRSRLH